MVERDILPTLRRKRAGIETIIAAHEAKIEAARIDLAAVDRSIRLFDPNAERDEAAAYFELGKLWKPGEIFAACRDALEREGPLDTRQLTVCVAKAKGIDDQDATLIKALTFRVTRALSNAMKRALVRDGGRGSGKGKGVRLWRL